MIEIRNIEKRCATLSDVMQSFGRVWAFIQNINGFDSGRFSFLPGFLDDMLTRLEWSLNIYFKIEILILANVPDPKLGMRGLKSPEFNRRKIYNILQTVAQRFDPSIAYDYSRKTAFWREFFEYLQLISDDNFIAPDDPFVYWNCQSDIDFDSSCSIRKIALQILSATASAADLERIRSTYLLTLSPNRRNLKKQKVLKTIQIKSGLKLEQAESNQIRIEEHQQKTEMKTKMSNLIEVSSQDCKVSKNSQNILLTIAGDISYSSSDDTTDHDSGMGEILGNIDCGLSEDNIVELDKDILATDDQGTEPDSEVLDDSEVERFLDGNENDPEPPKTKRKMPGHNKVTQRLSALFDFDIYNERANVYYSRLA